MCGLAGDGYRLVYSAIRQGEGLPVLVTMVMEVCIAGQLTRQCTQGPHWVDTRHRRVSRQYMS